MGKEESILDAVKKALGKEAQFFNIIKSEALVEEENYLSMTVCLQPNEKELLECNMKTKNRGVYLQVDHFDNEFNLMVGEDGDTELTLSYGNIYAQLYWGEVLEEAD